MVILMSHEQLSSILGGKKGGHEQKQGKRHSMMFFQATKSVVPTPGKDREAWFAVAHGVTKIQTRLSD